MTTNWRDLSEELTPQQIRLLERFEATHDDPPGLLSAAREYAAENLTDSVLFGHMPRPDAAHDVFTWERRRADIWQRDFIGASTQVGESAVFVSGRQFSDGRCQRWITLSTPEFGRLTPDQARAFADALCAAAEEVDRLRH